MSHLNTTTTTTKPTIAFFGATGGCAGQALALSLRAGYPCTALVRNRTKLQSLLSTLNVSPEHLSNLTITEGDIHSASVVNQALQVKDNRVVDMIISGLGSVPKFTPNPLRPTLLDPTICETGTRTILSCLSSIFNNHHHDHDNNIKNNNKRPLCITISTTGISSQTRDIPYLMVPLYHWSLTIPHKDKKAMETLLVDTMIGVGGVKDKGEEEEVPISGFVVIRPSLLTDGAMLGKERVRVGWEVDRSLNRVDGGNGDEKARPAIGYTISRADVGNWIFQELIDAGHGKREQWRGKMISLTY